MAITLSKGQTISLAKERPGLSKVMMGLGWEPAKQEKKKGFFGLKKSLAVYGLMGHPYVPGRKLQAMIYLSPYLYFTPTNHEYALGFSSCSFAKKKWQLFPQNLLEIACKEL